jgi:cytochrome c biogenesis protein CcmG/thiol:disulfide interchange protein DsbE
MTSATKARPERADDDGAPRRRRHTARWAAGSVVVVLVVVAIVAATRPSEQATSVESPLIGHPAPGLSARDFAGQQVSLAADRGSFVVVNFFASWCPPCAAEEPNLVRFAFAQRQAHANVDMLSVDIDDSTAGARRFISDFGFNWPAIPDQAGEFASDFGVGSPPETFFIDPSGTVVAAYAGPVTYQQLNAVLAAARRG